MKIDKKVPLPPSHGGRVAKYPWAQMKVGDSIQSAEKGNRNIGNCALLWGKRQSPVVKFTSRLMPNGHIRVWRVQ